jgi:predicted nucleotidyltransferase
VKILRTLAQPSFPQLDAARLAAETGLSIAGVRRALRDLGATGILQPIRRGRTTFYALHADHAMARSVLDAFRTEAENQGIEHLMPTFWNHLTHVVDRITERDGVLFVLLFGSVARPPVFPGADVDLLVGTRLSAVTTAGADRRSRRGADEVRSTKSELDAMEATVMGHPVHILTMDAGEFEAKVRANDAFATNLMTRHVVLYQSAEYTFPWNEAASPPRKSWGGAWRDWSPRGGR